MKSTKALLLLLVMMLLILPAAVSCGDDEADNDKTITYKLNEFDEAIITSYKGGEAFVEIPAEIDGYPVVAIGDGAFYNLSSIEEAVIPEGVIEIGKRAFESCKNLQTITVAGTVKRIGSNAFNGCISLKDFTISGSSALNYVGDNVFQSCRSLNSTAYEGAKYLTLGNNEYGILLSAESTDIDEVLIHDDTEIIVGSAFSDCTALTEIILPKGLKHIGDKAFYGCVNLDKIYFNCTELGDLAEDSGVFEKVATKSVTMTLFVGDEVKRIPAYLMDSATRLRGLEFADDSVCESIGAYAFAGTPLPSITLPTGMKTVEEGAFAKCTWLKAIKLQTENLGDFAEDNNIFTDAGIDDGNVAHTFTLTIADTVERIPAYFLSSTDDVAEVIFQDNSSLKEIGQNAFLGSEDILKITILDKVAWCETEFANASANPLYCGNAYLYIGSNENAKGGLILDGVKNIADYVFAGYKNLEKVILPKELESIGKNAFDGTKNLKTIYYEGTEEEWSDVKIKSGNTQLDDCKIYFYCDDVPSKPGNYWRYNNGTPEIWSYNSAT